MNRNTRGRYGIAVVKSVFIRRGFRFNGSSKEDMLVILTFVITTQLLGRSFNDLYLLKLRARSAHCLPYTHLGLYHREA